MSKTFEYLAENQGRFIDEIKEFCRQPSISAQNVGMKEMSDLVVKYLKRLGVETRILSKDGFIPVIYGELKGLSSKSILIYNHYDVQPPDPLDEWESDPFLPVERDGKIYARGVSDNKGTLLSRLYAIEAMLKTMGKLPYTIKFLIEGEEEIGSPNLKDVLDENAELLKADLCLWENSFKDENDRPVIRLGNKGFCIVELHSKVLSKDYHSRFAPILPNAVWRLVWALASLKDQSEFILIDGFYDDVLEISQAEKAVLEIMDFNEDRIKEKSGASTFLVNASGNQAIQNLYSKPTCNIAGIKGGYTGTGAKTILPAKAFAKVDIRLVPNQDPDDIYTKLVKHLQKHGFDDISVRPVAQYKASKTRLDDPYVKLVCQAGKDVYGEDMVIEPNSPGSGPRFLLDDNKMPIIAIGVGYAGSNNHAPNENIKIIDFFQATKHVIKILEYFSKEC